MIEFMTPKLEKKMEIGKPNAVYIQIQDRKNKKFKSVTLHGVAHEEVVNRIVQEFSQKASSKAQRERH